MGKYVRTDVPGHNKVKHLRVDGIPIVSVGDPVKTIMREAERLDAELVVVGSHGHGMMFDALVGSISAGVLRKSTIPVLVVPVREF